MRFDTPNITPPESGDYRVRISKGYGDPSGSIILDETSRLELERISIEDCDRLIKAAAAIKSGILAYLETAGYFHGRDHFYKGECQLCGKPEDDALHAEPVITDSERTCDAINPEGHWPCHESGAHHLHRDHNGDTWADEPTGMQQPAPEVRELAAPNPNPFADNDHGCGDSHPNHPDSVCETHRGGLHIAPGDDEGDPDIEWVILRDTPVIEPDVKCLDEHRSPGGTYSCQRLQGHAGQHMGVMGSRWNAEPASVTA